MLLKSDGMITYLYCHIYAYLQVGETVTNKNILLLT